MDGVPEGEGRDRLQAALDALAADEPAHARPPLLHRPGHERARCASSPIAIGRKLVEAGRARRPRGRVLPPLQRARASWPPTHGPSTRGRSSRDRRDEREDGASSPAAATGSAPRPRRRSRSRTASLWGFPEKFHRARARRRPTRCTGSARVARRGRGRRAQRRLARRVRPGAAGRDPRLPDDEPGLGRAVHEDRAGSSPTPAAWRRTPPSSRASSGSRPSSGRRTRPSGSRPATGSASTARPGSWRYCDERRLDGAHQ